MAEKILKEFLAFDKKDAKNIVEINIDFCNGTLPEVVDVHDATVQSMYAKILVPDMNINTLSEEEFLLLMEICRILIKDHKDKINKDKNKLKEIEDRITLIYA